MKYYSSKDRIRKVSIPSPLKGKTFFFLNKNENPTIEADILIPLAQVVQPNYSILFPS